MEGDPVKCDGHAVDRKRADRLSEASSWLLRLQEPTRTAADYDDWLQWCDDDPENFAAFEIVQRRWQDLDALKAAEPRDRSARGGQAALVLTPEQKTALLEHETRHALMARRHARRWLRRASILAAAAGLAAITWTAVLLYRERLAVPASPPQHVAAQLLKRAATLPDGSKMILGVQSAVNMDFSGLERQLDLSVGTAYFEVKHDKKRPFVVQAGEVSVLAIGTAFDVRRGPDKVTVTVEEGTVEVRRRAPGKQPAVWRAAAGYQLTYFTEQRTASIASVDPIAALAWRTGALAYLHEPLGTVIQDLNRHASRKVVIADPEVAEIPFTGTAFAASVEDWLAAVEQAYPIEVEESSSGDFVLSARR